MKSNKKESKLDSLIYETIVVSCKLIGMCVDCPFCDYCNFLSKNFLSPSYKNFIEWLNEEVDEDEED